MTQEETSAAAAPRLPPEKEPPTDTTMAPPAISVFSNSIEDEKKASTNTNTSTNTSTNTVNVNVKPINQKTILSANEYHNTIQKDAIRKPGGMLYDGNASSKDDEPMEWVDDFGNRIVDPSKGKYVDSFGHPLIRGADDDQVASFREIRNLSKSTWTMIDSHRKEKERQRQVSNSTPKKDEDDPPLTDDGDDNAADGDKRNKGNRGDMPSFLRRKYF